MKKRIGLIFSVMLFALVGLTACGNPYKNMKFSLSSERNLDETIELFLNKSGETDEYDIKDSVLVDAVVSGVGKNLSTDILVPDFNTNLDIETTKGDNGKTTIKFTAKSEGETKVVVSPLENPDGKFTRTLTFKVSIGVTSIKFKPNAITAIAEGGNLDLSVNPRTYLDILPNETSQTGVKYEILYEEGSPRDYATIIDNVLYTYKSDNYPVSGNVKYVSLKTTSTSREQLNDIINIPVIDVDHKIDVKSNYGEKTDLTLTKNNSGKYEVLLAAPSIGLDQTSTISKEMSSRSLHIALGEGGEETSKYSISVEGDPNTINSNSCISLYPGTNATTYFEYNVNAKYKSAAYDVTFKLEYIGDESDNPEGDPNKFVGVFTKYITFTFRVYIMPNADSLYINGSNADNQDYIIYDAYFTSEQSNISAENGTPIKVQERFATLPNLTYSLSYNKGDLGQGIGENGLIIDGGKTNETTRLQNNSTFYLKHNYAIDEIVADAGAKLSIVYKYSLAPSYLSDEEKAQYTTYIIEKTINLEMKAGIKDISLQDVGLKITEPNEYKVFFEFPEGYDAEDTVDKIVGINANLVRFEYIDNQILVYPNDNFETGIANLCVVAKNGKQSNYVDVVVYLPVMYTSDNIIKIEVDESDSDVFVVGKYEEGKGVFGRASGEVEDEKNNIKFTYDTISDIVLASNGTVKFNLYSLMINNSGNLESVLPNVNIRLSDDTKNNPYVTWVAEENADGVLEGTLITLDPPADRNVQTLTFILTGYQETPEGMQEVEIAHTVNIWIFPAISQIEISSFINELYLEETLGYYDIEKNLHKYNLTYTTNPKITGDLSQQEFFGEFEEDFAIKNKDVVVSQHPVDISVITSVISPDNEERIKTINGRSVLIVKIGDFITFQKLEDGNVIKCSVLTNILDKKFEVTYIDNTEEKTEEWTLFEIVSLLYNNTDRLAILDRIFGQNEFIDAEIGGKIAQFGRSLPVATTIRMKMATKVSSITTTIPLANKKPSLYFELGDGVLDEKNQFIINSQSFTYRATPESALNKEIDFKVFDKNDLTAEYNLKLISTQLYTMSADNTLNTNAGILYFNSTDNKLYTKYENGEYSDEYEYSYTRISNYSFAIEEERNTNENSNITIAHIRVVDKTITVSNVIQTAGDYLIHIIAKDSYFADGVDGEGNDIIRYSKYAEFELYISDGTKSNPYQIRDTEGLIKMWRRNINLNRDLKSTQVYYYKLMNNLNINNNNFNDYLFDINNIFRGGFDGNNLTINGLTINHTADSKNTFNIGLFPVVEKGTDGEDEVESEIIDLTLSNVRVNANVSTQSQITYNIGGLAGKITDADVINVWVRGNITLNTSQEVTREHTATNVNIGGVVGYASNAEIKQEDIVDYSSSLNSNVAIAYKALAANVADQGTHNLGGIVGLAESTITLEGLTVIPNIISAQKDGQNVSRANMGGLIGQLKNISENVAIKDIVISPNLKGFENVGGIIGADNNIDNNAFINVKHVVVEFQYTETLKNSIMGYDKVGGFVGNHTTGTINFDNSYVRNFYTGETNVDEYAANKFNGNILLMSSTDINNASAGGFVGVSNSAINLYISYFMGAIRTYADSNYVAGIVGNNKSTLNLTNSYVDGNVYGTEFPLAIVGGAGVSEATLVQTGISSTTTKVENELRIDDNNTPEDTSDDKWVVGSYYKVSSTTTENGTYNQYEVRANNITIKQFYSRLNNNYVSFVNSATNSYIVKEANSTITVNSVLTFAVLTEEGAFVVCGTKEVQNFTLGKTTTTSIIDSAKADVADDNNVVAMDKEALFKALGFIGVEDNEEFYLNAYKFNYAAAKNVVIENVSVYDLYIDLIYSAYNTQSKNLNELKLQYPNLASCVQFVNTKATYDVVENNIANTDFVATNSHIGAMYNKTLWADVDTIFDCLQLFGQEYYGDSIDINEKLAFAFMIKLSEDGEAKYNIALDEDGVIYAKNGAEEWQELEGIYFFGADYNTAYSAFNGQVVHNGTTYYIDNNKLYVDMDCTTEYTGVYEEYKITEDDYTRVNKVRLYKDSAKTIQFEDVLIESTDNGYVIELDGTKYALDSEYKVILPQSIYEITQEYGFKSTTTVVGEDNTNYLKDDKGNIIAYKDNVSGKFIYNESNAVWAVTDEVNSGLPVLFKTLEAGIEYDKLSLLYDSIGHMTGSVVEFDNGEDSNNVTDKKQAYIMVDENNVVLFYNSIDQNQNYEGINQYLVVMSEEDKEEVEKDFVGNQAPIIIDFSNVVLKNSYITLNGKNEYSVSSNNTSVLSVSTTEINSRMYNAFEIHNTGSVVLRFKNKYDDQNTFEINVFVVGGITGAHLFKANGNSDLTEMTTYVTKSSDYKFGFVNNVYAENNTYTFAPADGGFDVELMSGEDGIIKINNQLINAGTTYSFDMSQAMSIYGVKGDDEDKSKTLELVLRPYVVYGDNQRLYLSYMNKYVDVIVNDLAKSLTMGITESMTLKPEENTSFSFKLVSSNKAETVYLTIKENGQNIYLGGLTEKFSAINDMLSVDYTSTTPKAIDNNLFETEYTVYLSMNMNYYFDTYQSNMYQNPLASPRVYTFDFVPESWLVSTLPEASAEEYKSYNLSENIGLYSTAKFIATLEGNKVDEIQHTLYAVYDQANTDGNYVLDTNVMSTTSLAPGSVASKSYGLLKLKLQKEYNNAKYIEITTKNTQVSLEQCVSDLNTNSVLNFKKTANPASKIFNSYGEGIRLWNILYSSGSGEVDYVSQYYILVGFNEKVTQGSNIDFVVRVYNDNGDIIEKTIPITVLYLPKIDIMTMDGEQFANRAVGEYLPLQIKYVALEGEVTWSIVKTTGAKHYDIYDETDPEGNVVQKEKNNGLMPYLVVWDSVKGEYVRAKDIIPVEELDLQYAIFVPVQYDKQGNVQNYTALGKYTLAMGGYKVINTRKSTTQDQFTLTAVVAEIENVIIKGTVNNILTVKFSNYATFEANVIFNDFVEKIMKKSYNTTDLSFEAEVYRRMIDFEKLLSGINAYQEVNDQFSYLNSWYMASAGNQGERAKLNPSQSYIDGSFTFFSTYFTVDNENITHYYGITASKISTTQLYLQADYMYVNGRLELIYSQETEKPENSGSILYPFTLDITDNSDVDHPNPIRNMEDFLAMFDFVTEEQVNSVIAENPNVDPSELEFGNYILLTNLVLENWTPRELHVSNFDANGFTITIKSWNFNGYDPNTSVVAGLFSKVGQYTMVQNLNVNIAHLLTETKIEQSPTSFVKNGVYFKDVTFGIVAGENDGIITNTKVVNLGVTKEDENGDKTFESRDNWVLNIDTKQGYADGELCNAVVSPFVAVNSGSISNSFVGLNAVDGNKSNASGTVSTIQITYATKISLSAENKDQQKQSIATNSSWEIVTDQTDEEVEAGDVYDNRNQPAIVYPFAVRGGNKLAGFVNTNGGIISNCYTMGVSVYNSTNINTGSLTGGFVNNNLVDGTIYSCFVSGHEYSGYNGEDVVDLRATKSTIESRGDIGAFVHTNQGVIENAYAMLNIIINSRYSAGFVYNNEIGTIKNAYTTSITQNIYTQAHGMFIKQKDIIGTLTNCYYLLKEGEMGLNSNNCTPEVLASIDPTNAIVSYPTVSGTYASENKEDIAFANPTSFEGFTFVSSKDQLDGIWYMGETNYPRLINTINYNTLKVRSLISFLKVDAPNEQDVTKIYNYTYVGNPNIGTIQNPLIISKPVDFARSIITNSNKYTVKDIKTGAESSIYVFGDRNGTSLDQTTYNTRYIRLVNNISFNLMSLKNTYKVNNADDLIPLSQLIFNGMLIGNGMTINDIILNNTNTSGNNLEDFGLFKQVGLSTYQQENIAYEGEVETLDENGDIIKTTGWKWDYSGETKFTQTSPLIYNVKFGYQELSDPTANKVGLIAGSIYDATLLSITVEGQVDDAEEDVSIVTGGNLVGALAGLIVGSNGDTSLTMSDIDIKNVRIKASKNVIVGLSDTYYSTNGYYDNFLDENLNLKAKYEEIDFDEDGNITNINDISYAGGVAGVILANNFGKTIDDQDLRIEDMSTYSIVDYRDSSSKLHDITVSKNIEIVGDQAGGLFGYIGQNTHLRNSKFVLMDGTSDNEMYQRVYGYAFAGLIAGETYDSVLERVNVEHGEAKQFEIDSNISTITSEQVSKSDLFLQGGDKNNSTVAIGGITGRADGIIVLDSYNKANVTNINAKIAGGIIGYASGKNAIAYTHTYANVKAREIMGGLIGLYVYDSFELHLNNATAMNVWDQDAESVLKTNYAIYENATDVRMPELGNQMSENYLSKLNKITSHSMTTMSPGNVFVFLGSVLGKATLAPNTYKFDGLYTIEIDSAGNIYLNGKQNNAHIKDVFVHSTRTSGDILTYERLLNKDEGDTGRINSIRMFNAQLITQKEKVDANGDIIKDENGNIIYENLPETEYYYAILHGENATLYRGDEYVVDDAGNLVKIDEVVFTNSITYSGLTFDYNETSKKYVLTTTGGTFMKGSTVPNYIVQCRAMANISQYVGADGIVKEDVQIDFGTGTGGGYINAPQSFTYKQIVDGVVVPYLELAIECGPVEGTSYNENVSTNLSKDDLCEGFIFAPEGGAFLKMGEDIWVVDKNTIKTEINAQPEVVAIAEEPEQQTVYYVTSNKLSCSKNPNDKNSEKMEFEVNNLTEEESGKYVINWDKDGKMDVAKGNNNAYDYFAHRVFTHSVSKTSTGIEKNRYFTYYNDMFYNVYSSTYGVTTRTGSEAEGNLRSTFTGLSVNNEKIVSWSNRYNVRFDTIFGTQYPISKMTGYYAVSQHQYGIPYEEYIHVFNTEMGYAYDITEDALKGALKDAILEPNQESKLDYNPVDLITGLSRLAGGQNSAISDSNTWFFNEETQLLEYRIGQEGVVMTITNFDQLSAAFNTNNKGKKYSVKPEVDENGKYQINLNVSSTNMYHFNDTFRGSLEGVLKEDTQEYPTLMINVTSADEGKILVRGFEGANIKNINFVFDLERLSGNVPMTSSSEYFGFVAPFIEASTFTNCTFTFTNMSAITSWDSYIGNPTKKNVKETKSAGMIFGGMLSSVLTNCKVILDIPSDIDTQGGVPVYSEPNFTVNSTLDNFGVVVGMLSGNSGINGLEIVRTKAENADDTTSDNVNLVFNQGAIAKKGRNYTLDTTKGKDNINVGGVVGRLTGGSNITNISSKVVFKEISGTYGNSATAYSAIGGIVGRLGADNDWNANTIEEANYYGDMYLDVASNSNLAIGGIAGMSNTYDIITNCFVNVQNNGTTITLNESNKTINATIKNNVATANDKQNNAGQPFSAVGGILGCGGAQISAYEGGYITDTDIKIKLDDAYANDIFVGGVVGRSVFSSTSSYSYLVNLADITVCESAKQDKLHVGGLFGRLSNSLTSSYMQGDIIVDGGKVIKVGGLAGDFDRENTSLNNLASYGDVKFVYNNTNSPTGQNDFLGGIIGTFTNQTTANGVTFSNVVSLSSIYPVVYDSTEEKYITDEVYSKYLINNDDTSKKKMDNVYIDPFISNTKYYLCACKKPSESSIAHTDGECTHTDNRSVYIKEEYLDTYLAHTYNYADAYSYKMLKGLTPETDYRAFTDNTVFAKEYKDMYVDMSEIFEETKTYTGEDENPYRLPNICYFQKTYESGSKYNAIELTSISGDIEGYNILTLGTNGASKEYIVPGFIINPNSVLVAQFDENNPDKFVTITHGEDEEGDTEIVNHGVLSNIAITSQKVKITKNYGVIDNLVKYSVSDEAGGEIYGLVKDNYGYIYRSGASITYTNIQGMVDATENTQIGGLVYVNYNVLDKVYCTSMIADIDLDGGTTYSKITSGGIVYENKNQLSYAVFTGTLLKGKSDNKNVVYVGDIKEISNKGKNRYIYSDNQSMHYTDDGRTLSEISTEIDGGRLKDKFIIAKTNSARNKAINYGRPYVNGGIQIPTGIILNTIKSTEISDISFYNSEGTFVETIFNLTDYRDLNPNNSSSKVQALNNSVVLINDIDISQKSNNVECGVTTINIAYSNTFNGFNHTIKGKGVSENSETYSSALFAGHPNIYNLTIDSLKIKGNGILADVLGDWYSQKKSILKNIALKNSKLIADGYFSGLIAGQLYNYNIDSQVDTIKFENNQLEVDGEYGEIGYFAGTLGKVNIWGLNITGVKINPTNITDKVSSIGGFAGSAEEVDLDNITIAVDCVKGYENVGGFIGFLSGNVKLDFIRCTNDETSETVVVEGDHDVGGIVGKIQKGENIEIINCINHFNVLSTLNEKLDVIAGTGGIVGTLMGKNAILNNCFNFGDIKGYKYVGGIVGYASNTDITNSTTNYSSISADTHEYVGGIVGLFDGINEEVTELYKGDIDLIKNNISNEISNCSVENSNLFGKKYIGGIAGYSSGELKDCNLNTIQLIHESFDVLSDEAAVNTWKGDGWQNPGLPSSYSENNVFQFNFDRFPASGANFNRLSCYHRDGHHYQYPLDDMWIEDDSKLDWYGFEGSSILSSTKTYFYNSVGTDDSYYRATVYPERSALEQFGAFAYIYTYAPNQGYHNRGPLGLDMPFDKDFATDLDIGYMGLITGYHEDYWNEKEGEEEIYVNINDTSCTVYQSDLISRYEYNTRQTDRSFRDVCLIERFTQWFEVAFEREDSWYNFRNNGLLVIEFTYQVSRNQKIGRAYKMTPDIFQYFTTSNEAYDGCLSIYYACEIDRGERGDFDRNFDLSETYIISRATAKTMYDKDGGIITQFLKQAAYKSGGKQKYVQMKNSNGVFGNRQNI